MTPVFSIITPVLNGAEYLPRCVASVADQQVHVEHIIVDGGSADGTLEWLQRVAPNGRRESRTVGQPALLRWVSRPNRGMYDALNIGLSMARGEWVGFLNADDQLLEGALVAVHEAAVRTPEVDVWYGDLLVLSADGRLLAWRRTIRPLWWLVAGTDLYVPSSALYVRRERLGTTLRFRPEWKSGGDEELAVRLFRQIRTTAHVGRPLAVFTWTGKNMSRSASALEETQKLKHTYAWWIRTGQPLWWGLRRVLKCVYGAWRPPPELEYAVYIGNDTTRRKRHVVVAPSWRWPRA